MKKHHPLLLLTACLLIWLCLAPFLYLLGLAWLDDSGHFTTFNYYRVFLAEPQYLLRFFRSLGLASAIAGGQVVFSTMAGYGFAKLRFPGKSALLFLLMVLMILPLQVTMVANFMVMDELGLYNTQYALLLPAIFVPLGTFIMTQTFKAVPTECIEAAQVDGTGELGAMLRIAVPMNRGGMACTLLLSFLDGWNMVEQPLVYLEEFRDYPISVALAMVQPGNLGVQLACCTLVMLPPIGLFALFDRELVDGITFGREKH